MIWRVNSDPTHITRALTIRTGLSLSMALLVLWRCSAGTICHHYTLCPPVSSWCRPPANTVLHETQWHGCWEHPALVTLVPRPSGHTAGRMAIP